MKRIFTILSQKWLICNVIPVCAEGGEHAINKLNPDWLDLYDNILDYN